MARRAVHVLSRLNNAQKSLRGYLYARWKQWQFENRIMPAATVHCVDNVTLSVRGLSPYMKRRILENSYETSEIELCRQIVSEGDRILEVGAGLGFVGLFCLVQMKAGAVISVEANPETVERLKENYRLNQRQPNVIPAAVSDRDGTVLLKIGEDFWADSVIAQKGLLREVEVRTVSLPTVFKESGVDLNCMVIDAEGAEVGFAWSSLPTSVEKIIIELHPKLVGYPASFKVLNELQNQQFRVEKAIFNVYALIREASL